MADMQIVPVTAPKNVEAQYVEMMVPLYSYGCGLKVKKALSHFRGIYSVEVDYYQQKVTVWGICNKYDVLAIIKNKRKGARFWNQVDNIQMEEESLPELSSQSINHFSKPSLTLAKARSLTIATARSLSWKAWRKVFDRSNSF